VAPKVLAFQLTVIVDAAPIATTLVGAPASSGNVTVTGVAGALAPVTFVAVA